MTRSLSLLALVWALLLPALMIGHIVYERHRAPVYLVKIAGYDPRDLLYGRYITFRYEPDESALPAPVGAAIERLPTRFYIDERHAPAAERLLMDETTRAEIEFGVPARGKPFIRDLRLNGAPWRDALTAP